jgi:20S proteasome subunit beta 7
MRQQIGVRNVQHDARGERQHVSQRGVRRHAAQNDNEAAKHGGEATERRQENGRERVLLAVKQSAALAVTTVAVRTAAALTMRVTGILGGMYMTTVAVVLLVVVAVVVVVVVGMLVVMVMVVVVMLVVVVVVVVVGMGMIMIMIMVMVMMIVVMSVVVMHSTTQVATTVGVVMAVVVVTVVIVVVVVAVIVTVVMAMIMVVTMIVIVVVIVVVVVSLVVVVVVMVMAMVVVVVVSVTMAMVVTVIMAMPMSIVVFAVLIHTVVVLRGTMQGVLVFRVHSVLFELLLRRHRAHSLQHHGIPTRVDNDVVGSGASGQQQRQTCRSHDNGRCRHSAVSILQTCDNHAPSGWSALAFACCTCNQRCGVRAISAVVCTLRPAAGRPGERGAGGHSRLVPAVLPR